MNSDAGALLEVRDLRVEVVSSHKQLIRGISFTVTKGEIVGLVGQSGSGKSLTSLAIAGLLPDTIRSQGSILLNEQEIIGAPESIRNKIRGKEVSIVFQEPAAALDPLMKVGKQIALPLMKFRGFMGVKLQDAIFSLMEEVKLNDIPRIAQSLPHELSGGQRQRAAIALALACSPALLIADEPTSSTDAVIQKQLVELIQHIAAVRRIAVLFISHDIAVVNKIARRIMVMNDGLIVEEGKREELINNPQREYTKLLIKCARELDQAVIRNG
jgi:peptide/nickel transport system ATP-binding protein